MWFYGDPFLMDCRFVVDVLSGGCPHVALKGDERQKVHWQPQDS